MSPEQAAGEKVLDARSDVYSLACVMYEMIAGMRPFDGPTNQSVIVQRMTHGPRPIRVYRPAVPQALEQVIARGLAPVPADRYQSAAEFSAALSAAHAEGLVSGRTVSEFTDETLLQPARVTRRRSFVLIGMSALAIATLGLWTTRSAPPALDANRVIVFPIAERGASSTDGSIGDEVALLIGRALEHTEPLRWI